MPQFAPRSRSAPTVATYRRLAGILRARADVIEALAAATEPHDKRLRTVAVSMAAQEAHRVLQRIIRG